MLKMIISKLFSKGDNEINVALPIEENGQMILKIDNLTVGYLSCKNGEWIFKYSEEFKAQTEYHMIIGFPDLNEEYHSDELWPFFRIRIPGLKQPLVREIMIKENIKENEYDLLKRFGKKTIANPYELV